LARQVYPKKRGKRGQAGKPHKQGLSCKSAGSNELGMFTVPPRFLFTYLRPPILLLQDESGSCLPL
jgi:hypothetical protein